MKYYLHLDDINKYSDTNKIKKLTAVEALVNQASFLSHCTDTVDEATHILVSGGDGTLQEAQRLFIDSGKSLYGINAGRKGNLMNSLDHLIPLDPKDIDIFDYPIIPYKVKTKDGTTHEGFYVSEMTIGSHKDAFFEFQLEVGTNKIPQTLNGTALVINTPQGMTGYAGPMHEPLLPIDSDKQRIIGGNVAGFDYLHFSPQIIKIHDTLGRRPLEVSLDGRHGPTISNVSEITLYPAKNSFKMSYHKKEQFKKKRELLRKTKNTEFLKKKLL